MKLEIPLRLGELLDKPYWEELELTVRTYNALYAANIKTIRELVTKEEKDLLEDTNFEPRSVNEIKEQLANFRLILGMDLDGIDEDMVVRVQVIDSELLVDIELLLARIGPSLEMDEDMDEYPDFDDENLLALLKKGKLPTI